MLALTDDDNERTIQRNVRLTVGNAQLIMRTEVSEALDFLWEIRRSWKRRSCRLPLLQSLLAQNVDSTQGSARRAVGHR